MNNSEILNRIKAARIKQAEQEKREEEDAMERNSEYLERLKKAREKQQATAVVGAEKEEGKTEEKSGLTLPHTKSANELAEAKGLPVHLEAREEEILLTPSNVVENARIEAATELLKPKTSVMQRREVGKSGIPIVDEIAKEAAADVAVKEAVRDYGMSAGSPNKGVKEDKLANVEKAKQALADVNAARTDAGAEVSKKLRDVIENDPTLKGLVADYWQKTWKYSQPLGEGRTSAQADALRDAAYEEMMLARETLTRLGYDADALRDAYGEVANKEETEKIVKEFTEYAKEHPVSATVKSIGLNAAGGLSALSGMLESTIKGEDIDTSSPAYAQLNAASAMREAVSEDMTPAAQFAYNTGVSMADSLLMMPMGTLGTVVMGANALAQTSKEVLDNGGTKEQAWATGIVAGIAETLLEKVSLDQLKVFAKTPGRNFISFMKNVGKGMITEGSEEFFTDVVNTIGDALINGGNSEIERRYNNYIKSGMSEEDAWKKTAADYAVQLGLSFLGGAASGGVFGTGSQIIGDMAQKMKDIEVGKEVRSMGDAVIDAQIKEGLNAEDGTEQKRVSEKLEKKRTENKEYTDEDVGAVVIENLRARAEKATSQIAETPELAEEIETADSEAGNAIARTVVTDLYDRANKMLEGKFDLERAREELDRTADNVRSNNGLLVSQQSVILKAVENVRERLTAKAESDVTQTEEQILPDVSPEVVADREARAAKATSELQKSGILAGATDEQIEEVRAITEIFRQHGSSINVRFASDFKVVNGTPNGRYDAKTNTIYLNPKAENPFAQVIAHEIVHRMANNNSNLYGEFVNAVTTFYASQGKNIDQLAKSKVAEYATYGIQLSEKQAVEEVAAQFVESYIHDRQAIRSLVRKHRSVAEWLRIRLRGLLGWLKPRQTREARYIQDALDILSQEMRGVDSDGMTAKERELKVLGDQYAGGEITSEEYDRKVAEIEGEGGESYSITKANGNDVVWIDDNILKNKPNDVSFTDYIKNILATSLDDNGTYLNSLPESGAEIYAHEDLPEEFTGSVYTKFLRNRKQDRFRAKMRTATSLRELIQIATDRSWERAIHSENKDAKYGIYKYKSRFAFPEIESSGETSGVGAYTCDLVIINASDGKKYLYDIQNIKEDTITAGVLFSRINRRDSFKSRTQTVQPKGIFNSSISQGVAESNNTDETVTEKSQSEIDRSINESGEIKNDNGDVVAVGSDNQHVSYSISSTVDAEGKQKIAAGMSDEQRYDILKDKSIRVASYDREKYEAARPRIKNMNTVKFTDANRIGRALANEFGAIRVYENSDVELEFEYTNNNVVESMNKQRGRYDDYIKFLTIAEQVIENAKGLECHTDRYSGTPRADITNVGDFILIGAYEDEDGIVPVKLLVKQFTDKPNKLYVAITVNKIEAEIVTLAKGNTAKHHPAPSASISEAEIFALAKGNTAKHHPTPSASEYSLAQILENVNPADKTLIKYIPDGFLDDAQLAAKAEAIKEEREYIERKTGASYSISFNNATPVSADAPAEGEQITLALDEEDAKVAVPYEDEEGNLRFTSINELTPEEESLYRSMPLMDAEFDESDVKVFAEENEKLKRSVEYLKGQFKVTRGYVPQEQAVRRMIRQLASDYSAKGIDVNGLADRVIAVAKDMNDGKIDAREAYDRYVDIAKAIIDAQEIQTNPLYEEYAELRNYLRGTAISLDEQYRGDFDEFGGWNDFRKGVMGIMKLSNDGIGVDTAYDEISGMLTGLLDEGITNPADQMKELARLAKSLRAVYENTFTDEMAESEAASLGAIIGAQVSELPEAKTYADRMKDARYKAAQDVRDAYRAQMERVERRAQERLEALELSFKERDAARALAERRRQEERIRRDISRGKYVSLDKIDEALDEDVKLKNLVDEQKRLRISQSTGNRDELAKAVDHIVTETKHLKDISPEGTKVYDGLSEHIVMLADALKTKDIKEITDEIYTVISDIEELKKNGFAPKMREVYKKLQGYRNTLHDAQVAGYTPDVDKYTELTENTTKYIEAVGRRLRQIRDRDSSAALGNMQGWGGKEGLLVGLRYATETPTRIIEDIAPNDEAAKRLLAYAFDPVRKNEANRQRWIKGLRDRVNALNINSKVLDGNANTEAQAVQFVGEYTHVIELLGGKRRLYGMNKAEWQAALDEFKEANPKMKWDEVDRKAKEMRKIYDEIYEELSDVLVTNGYAPVNKRGGYFPHFTENEPDSVLGKAASAIGLQIQGNELPTSIYGTTATFKPGKSYFGNLNKRTGNNTTYDALKGFEMYINGASNVIHHTDDIQRLRSLARVIRQDSADQNTRKQIEEIVNSRGGLTDEQKDLQINEMMQDAKYKLAGFVSWLDEYTNGLANKKSKYDRSMEELLGRTIYSLVSQLEGRVAANMVALNPGSWLTNFIPLTQAGALIDSKYMLKAAAMTVYNCKHDDGFTDQSDFLVSRKGSDPVVMAFSDKLSSLMSRPMEWIDGFASQTIVRARYMQNVEKHHMSKEAALAEANVFAGKVMADRSKGATPTIFNSKNPAIKLFTQFQIEQNNQLRYLFKDIPRESEDAKRAALALVAAMLKFAVGAYLFNDLYEYYIGRRPAFDIIGILNNTVGSMTGYKLPNILEVIGEVVGDARKGDLKEVSEYLETKKKGIAPALGEGGIELLENLPFAGGVLGGGRLPIANAIGNPFEVAGEALALIPTVDEETGEVVQNGSVKRLLKTAYDELSKPLYYLAPKFGGGQAKKVLEGAFAIAQKGSYTYNKKGEAQLQYPVLSDNGWKATLNWAGALVFGKTSTPWAREWIENNFKTRTVSETAAYKAMLEIGEQSSDAYAILDRIKEAKAEHAAKSKKGNSPYTSGTEAALAALKSDETLLEISKAQVYKHLLASSDEKEYLYGTIRYQDPALYKVLTAIRDVTTDGDISAKAQKQNLILDSDLSDAAKVKVYRVKAASKEDEDFMDSMMNRGVSEFITLKVLTKAGSATKNSEKYKAVSTTSMTEAQRNVFMKQIMTDSQYSKYNLANSKGITTAVWAQFTERLEAVNKSGAASQEEVKQALAGMNIAQNQKAAIWQLQNKSWKAESNPFNPTVGKLIKDQME